MCLIARAVTLVRAKIEANLPRKRGAAAAGYEKAINRFYEKVGSSPGELLLLMVTSRSYPALHRFLLGSDAVQAISASCSVLADVR